MNDVVDVSEINLRILDPKEGDQEAEDSSNLLEVFSGGIEADYYVYVLVLNSS